MDLRYHTFRWLLFLFTLLSSNISYSANLEAKYTLTNDWIGGGQIVVDIKNTTSSSISNWTVEFDLSSNQQITALWNGSHTVTGNHVVIKNPDWFQSLNSGASTNFGFVISSPGAKTISNLKAYTGSTPTPTPDPTIINLQPTFELKCDWVQGYHAQITIKNSSAQIINNWTIEFDLESGQTIYDIIDGAYTVSGNHVIIKNLLGATLAANASKTIGVVIKGTGVRIFNNLKATSTTSVTPTPTPDPVDPSTRKLVAYFPNWFLYAKPNIQSFEAKDIKADLLTHVNYAFAKPYTTDANRNVISYKASLFDPWADIQFNGTGHFGQLIQLKKQYPHLKTLLGIGGWTIMNEGFPAAKFSIMAESATLRKEFIDSVIDLCITYEFDGMDMDFEYPGYSPTGGRPQDKQNFTILMRELHTAFKNEQALAKLYAQKGKTAKKSLLLTMAAPAGHQNIENIEVAIVKDYVDWFNLMTYDFHGEWDPETNHNAPFSQTLVGDPLFNVKSVVDQYLKLGVPAEKLILGMPLYGHSFAGVQSTTDGLFAKFAGPGDGTDPNQPGMLLYHDIKNRFMPTYTRYWDSQSQVPYLYNKTTKQFISYDDEQSLGIKSKYLKDMKLGGAMFWCLAKEQPQWDLISKVKSELATA